MPALRDVLAPASSALSRKSILERGVNRTVHAHLVAILGELTEGNTDGVKGGAQSEEVRQYLGLTGFWNRHVEREFLNRQRQHAMFNCLDKPALDMK